MLMLSITIHENMDSIRPNVLLYSVEKKEHNLESEHLNWNPTLYLCGQPRAS